MPNSVFANLGHVLRSRDPAVDQRRASRDLVDMLSHVTAHGRTHGVRIINISPHGLMCRSDSSLLPGERICIWLPLLKDHAAEVRWVEDNRVGLEFFEPIAPKIYDAMLTLIPPRRTAW
ncbi:PilZ domain-containing protein [Sphingobium sp. HBC34]|uniref:PilZ domain-containing protein n=1 Tax=Sphingobium cyanobacteriorum TaxID=3063954 RepID=A0ABT8ZGW8_9SPHN|nr:PilZ domain-containing protein [Sphingobium sp. HBC34]MDO7833792.1 PilZ domain-containing protein [Sphingobium sp. HBC34]